MTRLLIEQKIEQMDKPLKNVTCLFPGGFKPVTGAHMALAQRYAENPVVKEVIMLIGPKDRAGFTRSKSIQIFNLINSNPKIRIEPTNFPSPIMAAYEYMFALGEKEIGQFALAASQKGDDYVRTKDFVPNVDKYKITGDRSGRLIAPGVDAVELTSNTDPLLYDNGEPISASSTRAAIEAGDYEKFTKSYPSMPEAKLKNIWQILSPAAPRSAINNEAVFSKAWWENELREDIEEVFAPVNEIGDGQSEPFRFKFWKSVPGHYVGYDDFDDRDQSGGEIPERTIPYKYVQYKIFTFDKFNTVYNVTFGDRAIENEEEKDPKYPWFEISFNKDSSRAGAPKGQANPIRVVSTIAKIIPDFEQKMKSKWGKEVGGYQFAATKDKANDSRRHELYMQFLKKNLQGNYFFKVDNDHWSNEKVVQIYNKKVREPVAEGFETPKSKAKHKAKISKLRSFLDSNTGKEFVYDFEKYQKTVAGVPKEDLYEGLRAEGLLVEGGAGGHMSHPYEHHGLTFNDMKEMISRALAGKLDIEDAVNEKTDGQNIQVTYKDGQVGFARNKGTILNPMSTNELITKFEGRGPISDAFRETGQDLQAAFSKIQPEILEKIFKNGRVFANMEIIYPATKNVISYDKAVLQFHNLVEYDETARQIETDIAGGAYIQRIIQDANAHMQNTFSFIPPQKIKLGPVIDFDDQQSALYKELDQLRDRYKLRDTDLVTDYHREWWREVITDKAKEFKVDLDDEVIDLLVDRWAFFDKSVNINNIKKQIMVNETLNEQVHGLAQFAEWVSDFDKKDVKKFWKDNIEPFESIFLRLGAIVLSNAKNFLAANPSDAVQQIKKDIATTLKDIKSSNNVELLKKVEYQLQRIQKLGGFEKIVPTEGIVFVYNGHTYKLTGAFAPVNQIVGMLKFAR